MKKAVLFDLDGTLLDTSRDIQRVLNASLKKFSVPEISHEQTLRYVGNGAKLLVERAAAGCDREVIQKIYADFFNWRNLTAKKSHLKGEGPSNKAFNVYMQNEYKSKIFKI